MSAPEVVISGCGAFSAFGPGTEALAAGVFAGRHGFREVTRFDSAPFRARWAGEAVQPPALRDGLLACARDALHAARVAPRTPAAVLLGTQGDWTGLTRFWSHADGARDTERGNDAHADDGLVRTAPIALAHELADGLELGPGRRLAFVNACIASANAIVHGVQLLQSGHEDLVLAAGAYLVDVEVFAKFDSGRAFAADGRVRAFSRERSGLLLGDGLAVLVLERAADARARGVRAAARVCGWGMSSDGYHVCQPEPHGSGLAAAMRAALVRAGLRPDAIDYVNAHGTGTRLNDPAEANAVRAVFGARRVPVSSTKSATGHTLEAAGALEAIVSALALREQKLPPTVGFLGPDPDCDLDCVPNDARPAALEHVMSVNAAFGGANAALVLGRAS
jgi:3-oxoacyl-[acyl-carrier-protein] synthase II